MSVHNHHIPCVPTSALYTLIILQVDHLGRQLMRGAADSEEVANQREGLLAELAAAQQVRVYKSAGLRRAHA